MASVPLTFFFIALVILIGFLTGRVFQLTRFPDIPILLSIGLLLGPLNRYALDHGFGSSAVAENIDISTLKDFAPIVSTLALIVILFDSVLKLDFSHFSKSLRPAFAHTLPTFLVTVSSISVVAVYVFGMPPLLAVVLAVALSNVGQTVSAAIIREIDLDKEVRSIYFIEMAIYDLISIPLLVSLLEFAQGAGGPGDAGTFAQSLVRIISISLMLGLVGGLLWIYIFGKMERFPYSYMVTLAGLLFVYSLNAFLGGSGPVSVLIFGLVIGNRAGVIRFLGKTVSTETEGERVGSFHDEITFFVRSFFFIFLGLTFATGMRGQWIVESPLAGFREMNFSAALFLVGIGLIFFCIVMSRYVVVRYISARRFAHRMELFAVYGRGLGTAVLATFPFTLATYEPSNDVDPNAYTRVFEPWESVFLNSALLIILLTVAGTSLTVWSLERQNSKTGDRAAANAREAVKE